MEGRDGGAGRDPILKWRGHPPQSILCFVLFGGRICPVGARLESPYPGLPYKAIISYTHADETSAERLQAALETFRIDKALQGLPTRVGPVPESLRPILRDRSLAAPGRSLGSEMHHLLRASQFLIAICSLEAAASEYFNEEIRYFRGLGREGRILVFIPGGVLENRIADCLPPALLEVWPDSGGQLDLLIADAREGRDGWEIAKLKLVAGLLGLPFATVAQHYGRTTWFGIPSFLDKARRRLGRGLEGFPNGLSSGHAGKVTEIAVAHSDILEVQADLVVLKFADGLHGAAWSAAEAIGFDGTVRSGEQLFLPGKGMAATEVLFIGVGPLHNFRYKQIQAFGSACIRAAREHERAVRHLATTMHGPGYGLDVEQSFLSLVAGMVEELKKEPGAVETVTIADKSPKRCELLQAMLEERRDDFGLERRPSDQILIVSASSQQLGNPKANNIVEFGLRAENKARLFVAMPFSETYIDEFEIGFREAAKANDFVCERLDVEHFVGDIVAEIKKRILDSHGVIALLNDHNPNVFLEIGFAFAHARPTILVAKENLTLPFDISGHRCVRYKSISQLRELLQKEIAALKAQGILARRAWRRGEAGSSSTSAIGTSRRPGRLAHIRFRRKPTPGAPAIRWQRTTNLL